MLSRASPPAPAPPSPNGNEDTDTPDPSPNPAAAGARARPVRDRRTAAVMTTEEAAHYLGINKKTLDRMRGRGDGPRYIRLTSKIIRYR
jgi:predicted DNA-binding transcriptional regulator AlpA